MGEKIDIACTGKLFKAAYSIEENEWQGNVSLQLKLKDIRE
jgi:single-stranded-DNA-specific exonuclease